MSEEFGSLSEASTAALASMDGMDSTAVDTSSAEPSETTPAATADPAQFSSPVPSGTKHKVRVRGQEEEVDYEELVKGYSRQADYTRSKQELAEHQRQLSTMQEQVSAAQQNLQQIYGSDPLMASAAQVAEAYNVPFSQALQAVVQYQLQQQQGGQAGPPMDANEIATVAQAEQIAQQQLSRVEQQMALMQRQMMQQMQEQVQATKSEIETSQKSQVYASDINTTLGQIFDQNPILTAVEGMEDLLRFKVYQADPATVEEAKDLFARFAQEQAQKIQSQFTELTKARAVQKQKLSTGGIEPPGGAGIVPQPTDHSFGSSGLRDAATAYIQNMLRG